MNEKRTEDRAFLALSIMILSGLVYIIAIAMRSFDLNSGFGKYIVAVIEYGITPFLFIIGLIVLISVDSGSKYKDRTLR